jgi:hypothetical protein
MLKGEQFTYQHVKGHQDREGRSLNLLETLNVHVDKLAGTLEIGVADTTNTIVDASVWEVKLGDVKLQKKVQLTILEFIHTGPIREYWDHKGRVHSEYFHRVDWDSMRKAMKSTSIQQRNWIVKRAAHDCAANAVLLKRRQKETAACKFCGSEETVLHVYKCQHISVQDVWQRSLKDLQKELVKLQTDPSITTSFIKGLQTWQNGEQQVSQLEQDNIGWEGILEGCIGTHWKQQQALYYKRIQSKKGHDQWAVRVIRKLWMIAWNMWENRNKKEHEEDKLRESEMIQTAVDQEIALGTQNIYNLESNFSDLELERAKGKNSSYSKAWLRQVRSIRARERRKEEQSVRCDR